MNDEYGYIVYDKYKEEFYYFPTATNSRMAATMYMEDCGSSVVSNLLHVIKYDLAGAYTVGLKLEEE